MSAEIKLPELGENIETADVVKVLVAAGDRIVAEQPLLELETNKATLDFPSPVEGTVSEVLVKDGDEIKVGQRLFVLGEGGQADAAEARRSPLGTDDEDAAEARRSPLGTDDEDAAEARRSPLGTDDEDAAEARRAPSGTVGADAAGPAALQDGTQHRLVTASPSVRRAARLAGVDISEVRGSGPGGRVSKDDVARFAEGRDAAGARRSPGGEARPLPNFENWGGVRCERMSGIRRATAEHLIQCWTQIPHVTQFDRADITELEPLRKKYADRAKQAGGKLTMAVMVVKVVASALKAFPKFNASVDMEKREIIFKDYVNVGIAVATERGLLVPVLRDTDKRNMVEIAAEVSEIARKARESEVSLEDLQGGTFTVTNLGSIGGTHFCPIINWPEVAILGMGRAQMAAGFEGEELKPKIYLPLSLSYDHRIIDGAEGARFLRWIVEAIEEPLLLSLEG